ncbi:MAG: M48 family peptidase [Dehalococcoidia bacterium]|nr:MAG: M48 family peptidase [Dehalococcoidia bacterium]
MLNPFFFIILIALLVEYALDIAASLLNLKALRYELPLELGGLYPPDEYRRSQEYTRTNIRFHLLIVTLGLVVLLVFWFSGGFNFLDVVVRSWGFSPIVNGVFYIGMLLLGYSLLTLSFGIYEIFVIEQRFGFNRTSRRTFILDRLKGLGLVILLGVPLLAAILALFQYAGNFAWLYGWATVTVVSLVLQFIAPTLIMPLFNKFTPLEEGELREAILGYAHSVNFPVKNVFVIDGSRRSSKSNAFFTGFGANKRIALFDTLIKNHTVAEMVAVLAHEIGHYKKKHVLKGTAIGILHTGLLFFLLSVFLRSPGLYQAFGMQEPSIYSGLLFFGLLYTPLEMLISLGTGALSRMHEREADRFAAETIPDRERMIDALKKLSTGNLSNLIPHPFYVFLNYSHPPLLERIKEIKKSES